MKRFIRKPERLGHKPELRTEDPKRKEKKKTNLAMKKKTIS